VAQPFSGQFGLRAKGGINKPSYYDFALLHELGDKRIANASENMIVTKTPTGNIAIAAWNLVDPGQHGMKRTLSLQIHGVAPDAKVTLSRVDQDHGNVLPHYAAMGKPLDPTAAQVEQLNRETALGTPEQRHLQGGKLVIELSPNTLVLVKLER